MEFTEKMRYNTKNIGIKGEMRMPTPNNAYNRIMTPVMEAETHGQTFILKNLDTERVSGSLVCELLRYGWRNAENEMKWFLSHQNCENCEKNGDTEYSAKAMQAINKLLDVCMKYAQIDENDAETEKTRQTIKNAIMDALTLDEDSGTFSFQLREKEHSSGINKERISRLRCESNGRKENAIGDKEYKKFQRNLFSPEPKAEARRLILQFAYLVKMSRDDTDAYLKKWVLTDGIRWDSPWELAAACEIEKNQAKESDRASDFLKGIEEHIKGDSDYKDFICSEEEKEYTKWERSYRQHCEQKLDEKFLCHWAWLLMIKRNSGQTQDCIPNFSEEEIRQKLTAIYEALCEYVKNNVQERSGEVKESSSEEKRGEIISVQERSGEEKKSSSKGMRGEIISIMKDRLLRLNAAVWEYAWLDGLKPKPSRKLDGMGDYYPPRRKDVLRRLPGTFDKIGKRCKEKIKNRNEENKKPYRRPGKNEIMETKIDPDSILYRPDRSMILELGSALGLTEAGFCQLLEIGGFYRLYARDFFEYALMSTLNDMENSKDEEKRIISDGFRFGVEEQGNIRCDADLDHVMRRLRQGLADCLEENYSQLACHRKAAEQMAAPGWVKFISEKLVLE